MDMHVEGNMKAVISASVYQNLGKEVERLSGFLKEIINGKYDCIVIISRRCYVIYEMFAILYDWSFEKIITDLGIYANKKKLETCNNIIVVDDIGYTGNSMKRVLKRIKKYIPMRCKINAWIYAVDKKYAKQVLNIKLDSFTKINIKCRCQLMDVQCHELSINLVSAILDAGMPYTTFVYPILGKVERDIRNEYQLSQLETEDQCFKKIKWETLYLNIEKLNTQWVSNISKYSCVRIYRALRENKLECFLPFLFLKEIRESSVNVWFSSMADSFSALAEDEIAKEIEEAIKEKGKWEKDALEYLTCMFSCFCSKALAEIVDLRHFLSDSYIDMQNLLRGSFSSSVINVLEKCDLDFANKFFDEFLKRIGKLDEVFLDTAERTDKCFSKLKELVSQNHNDMDVYEMSRSIFKWLKSNDSNSAFRRNEEKALRLDDIVYILKEVGNYDNESIYLAQIECWDVGIATYRFTYEPEGIIAKCYAGEISSVLTILKYRDLVREFFNKVYENQLGNIGKTQDDILAEVYKSAVDEKQYTAQEIENFKQIINDRNNSMYGLLV